MADVRYDWRLTIGWSDRGSRLRLDKEEVDGWDKSASLDVGEAPRRSASSLGRNSVKVRDVIKLVENDGWRHVRTKGSHRQFQHSVKPGTVTIAGKLGIDVPIGTLNSILKQARLKRT